MIHSVAPTIVLIDAGGGIDEPTRIRWASAFTRSFLEDFNPAWNLMFNVRAETPNEKCGPDEIPHYLLDMPGPGDPSGALAFHSETDAGMPIGRSFCGLARKWGDDPSLGADHENKELAVDELLNECVQDADGVIWAKECCDPCEAIGYTKDGVMCSDFVTPAWFSPPKNLTGVKFNHLGTIPHAFGVLDGGYAQKFDSARGWVQVGTQRPIRAELNALGLGRGSRRMVTVAQHNLLLERIALQWFGINPSHP